MISDELNADDTSVRFCCSLPFPIGLKESIKLHKYEKIHHLSKKI
jgi:hypothetical protein